MREAALDKQQALTALLTVRDRLKQSIDEFVFQPEQETQRKILYQEFEKLLMTRTEVASWDTKVLEAKADKKRTEESLHATKEQFQRNIEEITEVQELKRLELHRNFLRDELEKLFLKRAEVTSWEVGRGVKRNYADT